MIRKIYRDFGGYDMNFGEGLIAEDGQINIIDCPEGSVLLSTGSGWTCGDLPTKPVFASTVHTETRETILHEGSNATEIGPIGPILFVSWFIVAIAIVLLDKYVR